MTVCCRASTCTEGDFVPATASLSAAVLTCCRPGRAMAAVCCSTLLVLMAWPAATAAAAVTPDSLLNICMDAKHHKTEPGPEGQLYGQVRSSSSAPAPTGVTCYGVTRIEAGGLCVPTSIPSPSVTHPRALVLSLDPQQVPLSPWWVLMGPS